MPFDLELTPVDFREDVARELGYEPGKKRQSVAIMQPPLTKAEKRLSLLTQRVVRDAVRQGLTPVQEVVVKSILQGKDPQTVAKELGSVNGSKVTPADVTIAYRCVCDRARSALCAH